MRIEELDFSVRTYNTLNRAQIKTVEQLATMSDEQLATVRNMGQKSIVEIKEKLEKLPRTKQSNADRVRSMTDEELQKFLLDFEVGDIDYAMTFCDLCCDDAAFEQKSTDCEGCLLWWLKNDATLPQGIDWLRQPVKEVEP